MDNIAALNSLIGKNLSNARTSRGLTFEQLAKLAGVSKGMLVQIEQARTNPSIGTLCKIANALGVAVSRFIESEEETEVRIISPSDATNLWSGRHGSTGHLVIGFESPSLTEFWAWKLLPGEGHDGVAHPSGTREILYVQSGRLTLTVGGSSHTVGQDQTIAFIADSPHRYANEGEHDLRFLMVVCEPHRRKV